MITGSSSSLGRRQFLKEATLGAFAASTLTSRLTDARQVEDEPNIHNMLLFGEQTIFVSHLPLFGGVNSTKTAYRSVHRYQVILQASFAKSGKDVGDLYFKDRQTHPDTRIYTLGPTTEFVLSRLFTPSAKPRLKTFDATIFRDHLERPSGGPIQGLDRTQVTVDRVVHGRMFDPKQVKPTALEYILLGKGSELYLAHLIAAPPDFDHVLSVKLSGRDLTPTDLNQDVRLMVADRTNLSSQRLKEAERVSAELRIGKGAPAKVELEGGREVYFEENELAK
jgi:hypothetical protein